MIEIIHYPLVVIGLDVQERDCYEIIVDGRSYWFTHRAFAGLVELAGKVESLEELVRSGEHYKPFEIKLHYAFGSSLVYRSGYGDTPPCYKLGAYFPELHWFDRLNILEMTPAEFDVLMSKIRAGDIREGASGVFEERVLKLDQEAVV